MTATNCRNWKHCGEGTLLHPITQHPVTTFVVEQVGWGRIGEWYDYGNDPEGTFDLILSAPKLRAQRDKLASALKAIMGTCAVPLGHCKGDRFSDALNQANAALDDCETKGA